jgi:glycosyltransferase involved in cell wall biosynthesis
MIRVGFLVTTGKWLGGINYLKNLLFAISLANNRQIEPIVFLGIKSPAKIKDMFSPYARIVTTPLLDRYSPSWILWKGFELLGLGSLVLEPFLLRNGIQILSHSDKIGFKKIKSVNWIPDFQHRHLPGMFSAKEIAIRDNQCRALLEKSDRVILSSHDALKDAIAFVPESISKISVISFVAQPDPTIFKIGPDDLKKIKQKYSLPDIFCYLPNQFWRHKNHIVVFKALDQLIKEGVDVKLVCTGPLEDYRHPEHIGGLKKFIADHHLQEDILLLGQVPFEDVGLLYAAATVIINPSLFEGWSTSVEESKSLGKKILLSDIPVHREQAPRGGVYFDPHDSNDLAGKIKGTLQHQDGKAFLSSTEDLKRDLRERTNIFGERFQQLVMETVH